MVHLTAEKSKKKDRQQVARKEAGQEKGFGNGLQALECFRQSFFHSSFFRIYGSVLNADLAGNIVGGPDPATVIFCNVYSNIVNQSASRGIDKYEAGLQLIFIFASPEKNVDLTVIKTIWRGA